ncbi:MFS transporter [uncultured Tolumonas sp.]|uniref:MFS transporter n=1 Tax=uncultured Tolumonas sp. TaxID=263765 RepID=UPI002A0A1D85|nr:MFS transporter [uncultured Tolumonas sp.]
MSQDQILTDPPDNSSLYPPATQIQAGSVAFKHTNLAIFLGGFSTFWLLYWVQPILPLFARTFSLSPAASSTILSISTAALALSQLPSSFISDRFGRKPVMSCAMLLAAIMTLLTTFVPDYSSLLVLRLFAGIVLAGLPAVAMAYLAEEIEVISLGKSMGVYISGSAIGGMSGRLVTALAADYFSWHIAALIVGSIGLISAVVFWQKLPASQHFHPRPLPFSQQGRRELKQAFITLLKDEGLPWLYASGFILMGCFVSLYNYIGFHLEAAPFNLRPSIIGGIFTLFLVGAVASAKAHRIAQKVGRYKALIGSMLMMLVALLLTFSPWLPLVVLGITMQTFAFFGGHTIASSWVGQRAGKTKALGASLYLSSYYLGSSVVGSMSGLFWRYGEWRGVATTLIITLVITMSLTAYKLSRIPALIS